MKIWSLKWNYISCVNAIFSCLIFWNVGQSRWACVGYLQFMCTSNLLLPEVIWKFSVLLDFIVLMSHTLTKFFLWQMSDQEKDVVPMPIVLIDQDSDPDATIVQLSFGDRLGALLDTVMLLFFLFLSKTNVAPYPTRNIPAGYIFNSFALVNSVM